VRQQFIEAQQYQERQEKATADPSAKPPPRDLKLEPLVSALQGDVPVIMHAVEPMDIEAALRIAEEFDLRLVVSGSTQALEAQARELAERRVPVILGTYYASINSHTGEQTEFRYETAALLTRHGVKVAFGGLTGETKFLLINAGIAVQHGMPRGEAIKALTLHPAQMLGVDDRLGSLTAGKDADIVLYRGDPLQITSPVEKAFISGRLVYERQPFNPTYHNLKH
jgi:imidazolonepropionase-like amidohydrolase